MGNKTLAVLAEEAKEKHYVTLDVGAKVSGYTKEYLEHLCRINKVESRVWNNGQFVIELESLLTETHTILLSYEDIEFVDKSELEDPTPQIVTSILTAIGAGVPVHAPRAGSESVRARLEQKVADGITQSIPTFGEGFAGAISRVGRSVVSDPLHPEKADSESEENLLAHVALQADAPGNTAESPESTAMYPETLAVPHDAVVLSESRHAPIHLRVTGEHASGNQPAPVHHVSIADENIEVALPKSRFHTKNPDLHPISTSLDATAHHDPAPLFPAPSRSVIVHDDAPLSSPSPRAINPEVVLVPIVVRPSVPAMTDSPKEASPVVTDDVAPQLLPPEAVDTPLQTAILTQPSRIPQSRTTMLPSLTPEHHLMVRPDLSILKSPVLNIAFAVLVAGTVFTLGQETLLAPPEVQVASVAQTPEVTTKAEISVIPSATSSVNTPDPFLLPFSDDVVRATTTTGEVEITPVVDGALESGVRYPRP